MFLFEISLKYYNVYVAFVTAYYHRQRFIRFSHSVVQTGHTPSHPHKQSTHFVVDCLTFQDGTDNLSRNFGN